MPIRMLLLVMLWMPPGHAAERLRPDSALLADALTSCVDSLAALQVFPKDSAIGMGLNASGDWTRYAGNTVESALTAHGHSMADSTAATQRTLFLETAEFRVILRKCDDSWNRTVSAAFHYTVRDSAGSILHAGRIAQTAADTITGSSPEASDDVARFGPAARRTVIRENSGRPRTMSFLLFTSAILWLAFR